MLDRQAEVFLKDLARQPASGLHEQGVEEARRQMEAGTVLFGRPRHVSRVEDHQVPVFGGKILVRLYRANQKNNLPVILYFHGGGWVIGNVLTHDAYCRALAVETGLAVASVDYRLAPEHQFPTAAEDCYAAAKWLAENASELDLDGTRLAVAGDSAGGNLAAVVSLMARDRDAPQVACQALIYPITDHNLATTSYLEFAEGYYLERESMRWFWNHYVPNMDGRADPYVSPLQAERLDGLPPALVLTAEYDVLRDEGEAYAARLQEAGVPTQLTRYNGMIHGFARRFEVWEQSGNALRQTAEFLKQHLSTEEN